MEVTCLRRHFEELLKNPEVGEKNHKFQFRITSIDPLSVNAKCLDGCDIDAEIVGEEAEKVRAGGGHVGGEYTAIGLTATYRDDNPTVFIYLGA
jgi:hypothetical protein